MCNAKNLSNIAQVFLIEGLINANAQLALDSKVACVLKQLKQLKQLKFMFSTLFSEYEIIFMFCFCSS